MCQAGVSITKCPSFQENVTKTVEALINTTVIDEKTGCAFGVKDTIEIVAIDTNGRPQQECTYKVGTCSFIRDNTGGPKCGCTQETGRIYRYTLQFTARKKTHERGTIYFRSNCQEKIGVYLIEDSCPIKFHPCVGNEALCLNGGTCQADESSQSLYVCQCVTGYSGLHCQTDPCQHKDNPCLNGGNCTHNTTSPTRYTCTCPQGYKGDKCQDSASDPCQHENNPCQNGGNCTHNTTIPTQYTCTCPQGYKGDTCQASASESPPVNTELIVGGVVGGVVLLSLGAVLVLFLKRNKTRQTNANRGRLETNTPDPHNTSLAVLPSVPSPAVRDARRAGDSGAKTEADASTTEGSISAESTEG